GDSRQDNIDLKARPKRRHLTICNVQEERRVGNGCREEKTSVLWNESKKEIEMQSIEFSHRRSRLKRGGKYTRQKKGMRILYGKGIAYISGDLGIGKGEQEEAAAIRKELMRNIPYLVIIHNLESEKDWWDHN
ncbi:hypothetical protein V8G54_011846, partial [Vigna mungo]